MLLKDKFAVVSGAATETGAMYFWARHSDRTRERRWHFTIAAWALALGLALAVVPWHAVAFVGITLRAVGVLPAVPIFFTFPAAFLKGGNPASGLLIIAATVVLAPAIILALDRKKISEVE
jgi:hypothetical protein